MFPEQYIRNYLNDEVNAGDALSSYTDTFVIPASQGSVVLTYPATIYKPVTMTRNGVTVPPANYTVNGALVTFKVVYSTTDTVRVTYWA